MTALFNAFVTVPLIVLLVVLLGIWTEVSAAKRILARIERMMRLDREDAKDGMSEERRERANAREMWGAKVATPGPYRRHTDA